MAENSDGSSKIVETTPIKDDLTGRLNISRTGVNAAQGKYRVWYTDEDYLQK